MKDLLTKREQIAAMALQGILAAGSCDLKEKKVYFLPEEDAADEAVSYADALIQRLEDES
jgi:hypothetical protein